jgi:hypothetical protein
VLARLSGLEALKKVSFKVLQPKQEFKIILSEVVIVSNGTQTVLALRAESQDGVL